MVEGVDLQTALWCSNRAAALALKYFEDGVEATVKPDGSPVTEADRAWITCCASSPRHRRH